jgi:hypothetical protein
MDYLSNKQEMDYLYVILHVSAIITFLSYIFPAIERYYYCEIQRWPQKIRGEWLTKKLTR